MEKSKEKTQLTVEEIEALFALEGVHIQDESVRFRDVPQFGRGHTMRADGFVWLWWYTGLPKNPSGFGDITAMRGGTELVWKHYDTQLRDLWARYNNGQRETI